MHQGASIPLAAMTAAVGLYLRMGLPEPWKPAAERIPLIVYGASGAVARNHLLFPEWAPIINPS